MPSFLFQIELPPMHEQILVLIPVHREHINRLFAEGKLSSYSVSVQRDHIWCVVNAEEEKEAMEIVSGFPLQKFFADVSCHQLLFHSIAPSALPEISLN